MAHRRTVMISSTARDLPVHREQVRLACERAGFAPHDMMEHLPALNADAVEASLAMVEQADVYIGIFAYRYGTIADGHDKSITEMEYDRAVELDKPRLIFFAHDDHPVTAKDVDTGVEADKLRALKARIGQKRVAAFFKSAEDLRAHVVEGLSALAVQLDKSEPNQASDRTVADLHRRTLIPRAPQPFIAHPYTLLQTRDLVGRRTELNLLTDWVANPRSVAADASIFVIVAIGGMGKSAQSWTWFNQIAPNEMKPLAGRMWWSFYEADATFENFLIRAVAYVTGEDETAIASLPWRTREELLLEMLARRPFLITLDGLERILIAYNRMDASRLADDQYDQQTANYVANAAGLPESAAQSFVGQHRLRQTSDPRAGNFLRKLAGIKTSRILITSRLYPSELQLPTGAARRGCFPFFLQGLSNDDALDLWRGLGVTGSRAELLPIFNSVRNHPLLLQALASEIANYRRAPADFARWREDHPKFDPTSLPLVQSRTHILHFALQGLADDHREVLTTIAGFRLPASYSTLEALLVGPERLFQDAGKLDSVLSELEDRGLLGWDREANRYDAHPLVRGVVWQMAASKDKQSILAALDRHFEPVTPPAWLGVTSLGDLAPLIERYNILVELGKYTEAFDLFHEQLFKAAFYRLGAYQDMIRWLEQLVSDGPDGEIRLPPGAYQSIMLHELAVCYNVNGQPGKAAETFSRSLEEQTDGSNVLGLPVLYGNFGLSLAASGRIFEALNVYMKAIDLARTAGQIRDEMYVLGDLAQLEHCRGEAGRAATYVKRIEKLNRGILSDQSLGVFAADQAEMLLWDEDFESADISARKAAGLAEHEKVQRDLTRAASLEGQAALGLGDLPRASERLHDALIRARDASAVEMELPILVAIARLEVRLGHPAEAKLRLNDAWESLERGPYPLIQTDAFSVLAEAELALGNRPAAAAAADRAFRAAWCDGPPFAFEPGLRRARKLLAALGAPEPDLPPFDESRLQSLPEIEINPRDEYCGTVDDGDQASASGSASPP